MYTKTTMTILHITILLHIVFMTVSCLTCDRSDVSTCGECISLSYQCAWCSQKNFNTTEQHRCQARKRLEAAGCLDKNIEDPPIELTITENKPVQDDPATQVQPQTVMLKARPHKPRTFNLTFRAANNYPVDFYFLFDLSNSMKERINGFADIANDITTEIRKETSNVAMAYGAFQDKVALPFTNTEPELLKNPCHGSTPTICAPPFDFKHFQNMTDDTAALIKRIKQSTNQTTGNLDHPEGGLEAMIQVTVCKNEIKWRNDSRKLLIFATNDRFHQAGDGRLAGIVIPNDLKCHLNHKGKYTAGLKQDYPSVAQLSNITQEEDIHIIFLIETHKDKYDLLSNRIPNSNVATTAPNNSGEIKNIVVNKYKSIVSKVEMVVEPKIDGVEINIKAKGCEGSGTKTNVCKGIKIGDRIEFEVTVQVTECPKNPDDRHKTIAIFPNNLKRDKLTLELEIVCECNCASEEAGWEKNSEFCSEGNGTLKCGVCDCHEGRRGDTCECDAEDQDGDTLSINKCKSPGSDLVCSGVGECDCGKCQCDPDFSGNLCQCVDTKCGLYNGLVCGGPSRGRCGCSQCECEPEYRGKTCECPTSNTTCMYEGEVCNGHGKCECGKCVCENKYGATHCQKCILCSGICSDISLRECAICSLDKKDPAGGRCSEKCPDTDTIVLVDSLDENTTNVCNHKLPDSCFLTYQVEKTSDQKLYMKVVKEKLCPEPVDVWPIVGGIIGGVLLIALILLLLGKLITTLYDRREFSKFQDDLNDCKWANTENPMYKTATTTYKNPMMDADDEGIPPTKE